MSPFDTGRYRPLAAAAALTIMAIVGLAAQERDRAKIAGKYKWDLSAIYPSEEGWRQAKDKLVAEIPQMRQFKGTLASSASRLADALEVGSRLAKELGRAYTYASMMSDQDTRVSKYQGMQQEMLQIASTFGAEAAFLEPEILKIERATIDRFLADEPRLKPYRLYLDDIQRRRTHTGTDGEERLLAASSLIGNAPSTIYGIFADADFPYPTVTLKDGKSVKLDSSAFNVYRGVRDRDDRQKVMSAFFTGLGQYRGSMAPTSRPPCTRGWWME
ncbi:MAG: hypothetical protein LC804_22585 [Acidobacteria bacterium]|nr:hypothetical protein [Acidobacteriota bacterium]